MRSLAEEAGSGVGLGVGPGRKWVELGAILGAEPGVEFWVELGITMLKCVGVGLKEGEGLRVMWEELWAWLESGV